MFERLFSKEISSDTSLDGCVEEPLSFCHCGRPGSLVEVQSSSKVAQCDEKALGLQGTVAVYSMQESSGVGFPSGHRRDAFARSFLRTLHRADENHDQRLYLWLLRRPLPTKAITICGGRGQVSER